MPPSISIRDSIRWLPSAATEPTRTVVLTSPENRFVDIRVFRPTSKYTDNQDNQEGLYLRIPAPHNHFDFRHR